MGSEQLLALRCTLGGGIDVKSEPDQGTEVTLLLPLFETHSESDLQMLGAS